MMTGRKCENLKIHEIVTIHPYNTRETENIYQRVNQNISAFFENDDLWINEEARKGESEEKTEGVFEGGRKG